MSSDTLKETQAKMLEYKENGVRLGWLMNRLINSKSGIVEIYRQNQPVEVLNNLDFLTGEDILPEFSLNLRSL